MPAVRTEGGTTYRGIVPAQYDRLARPVGATYARRPVLVNDNDDVESAWAERRHSHEFLIPTQHSRPVRTIDSPNPRTDEYARAVCAQCCAPCRALRTHNQHSRDTRPVRAPHSRGPIHRHGDDMNAVRAERRAHNRSFMSSQHRWLTHAVSPPHSRRFVV